ncbi:CHASE2 domain-containing protein [Leptolyngbya sp. PCC 6406]|uniref:CHASE2 domain-containing protein n=1 Tax=Leptolyngbya sp. PCC 6406 TaxID=1173264 RepID=UPI000559E478|nr:CHASE2 domain-containing protein [Leptolyngbya sp. PCC 6406]
MSQIMYRLNIHKIDQSCLFELTWGQGQRITASLAFPAQLLGLYEAWRRAYLGYYKQGLRGRVAAAGQVAAVAVDWHSQVVQAEARLLSEFHKWLKHGDLFDLRGELMTASHSGSAKMELFLTCTPLEIARLPWETWEFGQQVQIVRAPATIRAATVSRQPFRRGKARVLAILGDETGLNFAGERTALNAQKRLLDLHYVGWQPGEEAAALKQRICQTIADPLGWDVLFFAGHSNEAAWVDGQVAIAPQTAISIKELSPYLQQAQRQGLQFALFNSCSGLDIANGLINLGLSQVAIMREPIHNEVAQTFLTQLLQRLGQKEDVQAALLGTCQFLKLEQHLTYPSAYLVPSLFRHPDSVPYQVQPVGWRSRLGRWRPQKREVLTVATLALLSLVPPLHNLLMDQRIEVQARYRGLTAQVPPPVAPPVVLLQIDQETFARQGLRDYKPINRGLLADILAGLNQQGAQVIGIDYILDLAQEEHDQTLNQVIRQGIEQNQIWTVFITARNPDGRWIQPYGAVTPPEWILQGDARVPHWYLRPRSSRAGQPIPFSYQLALAHHLQQQARSGDLDLPRPRVTGQPLDSQVQGYLRENEPLLPPRADLHWVTRLSYKLHQRWLQPLLDFSIPPDQVYTPVLAWEFLADPAAALGQGTISLADKVVVIAAGGYYEAGLSRDGEDNLPLPPGMGYWRNRLNIDRVGFTGGEAHAYMIHHLLTQRLVLPIPDLVLVLVAALVGKGWVIYCTPRSGQRWHIIAGLAAGTALYGVLSLQLYISGAVLLPWLLPSLTVWLVCWPIFKENNREQH